MVSALVLLEQAASSTHQARESAACATAACTLWRLLRCLLQGVSRHHTCVGVHQKLVDIYGRVAHSRGKMDASLASALSKVTLKTTGALQSEEVDTSGVEEALAGVAADLRRKVQDKLPRDSATRAVVVRTFLRKNDHDHDGRVRVQVCVLLLLRCCCCRCCCLLCVCVCVM